MSTRSELRQVQGLARTRTSQLAIPSSPQYCFNSRLCCSIELHDSTLPRFVNRKQDEVLRVDIGVVLEKDTNLFIGWITRQQDSHHLPIQALFLGVRHGTTSHSYHFIKRHWNSQTFRHFVNTGGSSHFCPGNECWRARSIVSCVKRSKGMNQFRQSKHRKSCNHAVERLHSHCRLYCCLLAVIDGSSEAMFAFAATSMATRHWLCLEFLARELTCKAHGFTDNRSSRSHTKAASTLQARRTHARCTIHVVLVDMKQCLVQWLPQDCC